MLPKGVTVVVPATPAAMTGNEPGPACENDTTAFPLGVTVQSGSGWLTEIGVAVSSPLPGTPFGSVMVVVAVKLSSSTFVAGVAFVTFRATHTLVGMLFEPVVSRPRL